MTKDLKTAFEVASRLPEDAQDNLAVAILSELEADARWDTALAASQHSLELLADEALKEHHAGHTKDLDPGTL